MLKILLSLIISDKSVFKPNSIMGGRDRVFCIEMCEVKCSPKLIFSFETGICMFIGNGDLTCNPLIWLKVNEV